MIFIDEIKPQKKNNEKKIKRYNHIRSMVFRI